MTKQRLWQGIPGLERTAGGRLYVTWFTGGPREPDQANRVLLAYSDDEGRTISEPMALGVPGEDGTRCFDPAVWIDPRGRLWFFFNRGNRKLARHDVRVRVCDAPDAPEPAFGEERRIDLDTPYAFRMNKPTVLSSGAWVLPVTHAPNPVHDWFAGESQLQGGAVSTDEGRTWELHGAVKAPHWALENMVVELKDGRLWMLIRTGSGVLWESHSSDHGQSWGEGRPTAIANPGSRFFIRRLASGNLLLVNHHRFSGRSHLSARCSRDEGQSWCEGLLLDERNGVSYPDGIQSRDGEIGIVYDRDRHGDGDILMARFFEEDVWAGKDVSGTVTRRQVLQTLPKSVQLPASWDPMQAANRVMGRLVPVCGPAVKGAHDSDFVLVDRKAYVVYMANDRQPGENAAWPFVYCALSVVDLDSGTVDAPVVFAESGRVYDNETLPTGACFVPRIVRKDADTLRCFFASESPGERQSQLWRIDFSLRDAAFARTIHRVRIATDQGVFPMQPEALHRHQRAKGFDGGPVTFGLYMIDGVKGFDGRLHAVLNNFPGGQVAWASLNPELTCFTVLGDVFGPEETKLTEGAANRLPDGAWQMICRNENGNYCFSGSSDGRRWTMATESPFVVNGTNSKPTFDRFGGLYYLGWQDAAQIGGCHRSVFNIDVSRDGKTWTRKYRFETPESFQYATLHEHEGAIWLSVTQGPGKRRIMFGKLEDLEER